MTEPPPEAALARPDTDETATGANRRRARVIAVAVVVPFLLVIAAVAVFRGGVGGPRKLPIAVAGDTALAGGAEGVSEARAPYGGVKYVAGPNLPALDGKARAYKITSTIDADATKRVASAFGLDGQPRDVGGGSLLIESADGQHRLSLSPGHGGWFSYDAMAMGGPQLSAGAADCPLPHPAEIDPGFRGGTCSSTTTTARPLPAGFPTADDARATALSVLEAAGVATGAAAVDVTRVEIVGPPPYSGDAWQVVVTPSVNGVPLHDLTSSVAIGLDGLVSAGGWLGHPEPVDEYPLIGTAKAIEHLNDGTAFAFPYDSMSSGGFAADNLVRAVPVVPASAVPPPTTAPPDASTCATFVNPDGSSGETCSGSASVGSTGAPGYACPAIGAVPPETVPPCLPPVTAVPAPPPEPQVVTLTDAKLGLVLAPSGAGDAYLLPSYVFSTADGLGPTALAIDSSWLEPVAPVESQSSGIEPQTTVIEPKAIPPAPPTTCGPPVASAPPGAEPNASTAARPADAVGCPIN